MIQICCISLYKADFDMSLFVQVSDVTHEPLVYVTKVVHETVALFFREGGGYISTSFRLYYRSIKESN